MSEEQKAPRGKWWVVGVMYRSGVYVPFLENTRDAPSRKYKLKSACQAECDKLNDRN